MSLASLNSVQAGSVIGRWVVLGKSAPRFVGENRKALPYWSCRCTCGVVRDVSQHSLRQGTSKSCGCLNREASSMTHKKHGDYKSPEYKTWQSMLSRCRNQSNPRFNQYGGRGIEVCQRWMDYASFLQDMGRRPSGRHSIDRIDNDKGYEPGNCRWALPHEQMTNRTITRLVEIDGEKIPLATLAKKYSIPANTLRARVLKGWPVQKALTHPVRAKRRSSLNDHCALQQMTE